MAAMSVLQQLELPIVGAPMAGGPSTPELAAAVSEAGGLGVLAAGYLTAGQMAERLAAARALVASERSTISHRRGAGVTLGNVLPGGLSARQRRRWPVSAGGAPLRRRNSAISGRNSSA